MDDVNSGGAHRSGQAAAPTKSGERVTRLEAWPDLFKLRGTRAANTLVLTHVPGDYIARRWQRVEIDC